MLVHLLAQGHIGLNEVAIGISVPLYWGRLMALIVGDKAAEHLCKFAVLLPPQDALKVTLPLYFAFFLLPSFRIWF